MENLTIRSYDPIRYRKIRKPFHMKKYSNRWNQLCWHKNHITWYESGFERKLFGFGCVTASTVFTNIFRKNEEDNRMKTGPWGHRYNLLSLVARNELNWLIERRKKKKIDCKRERGIAMWEKVKWGEKTFGETKERTAKILHRRYEHRLESSFWVIQW